MIQISELLHGPNDFKGQPIFVEGFLVSDRVDLWLTQESANWLEKKQSVQVGHIGLAKEILEKAPGFTMGGSVLLAADCRVSGVLSSKNGGYLLSFARVENISLKEDDGNWLLLNVQWPPKN